MQDGKLLFQYIDANDLLNFKLTAKKLNSTEIHSIFSDREHLSLLHWSVLKNSVSILLWLLDTSTYSTNLADNPNKWNPAHIAAMKGYNICLEALLKRIPNIKNKLDKRGRLPLHIAVAHGHTHCLRLLLTATSYSNTNINLATNSYPKWTPLMYAVWHGRISCVEILIRYGAITDMCDENGMTILHLAASEGHDDLVKYLLNEGFKNEYPEYLNTTDNNGRTPFELAMEFNKRSTAMLIKGAIDNPVTWDSVTKLAFPGHLHALDNNLAEIQTLLNNGSINLNDTDDRGYTMLHKAALVGSVDVVNYLLRKGANLLMKTLGGETCRDVAIRKNNFNIVDLLDDKMKKLLSNLSNWEKFKLKRFNLDCENEMICFEKWLKSVSDIEEELTSLKKVYEEALRDYNEDCAYNKTDENDKSSSRQLKLCKVTALNYKIELAKFNLYLLKENVTDKEIEIARVLADCEHELGEANEELQYEREIREKLQAELTFVRQNILKIKKVVCGGLNCDWKIPDDLFRLYIFDNKQRGPIDIGTANIRKKLSANITKFSMQFSLNTNTNCITIVRVFSKPYTKLPISDHNQIKDITKAQFLKYVRNLINFPVISTKLIRVQTNKNSNQ